MTRKQKVICWVVMLFTLPTSGYAVMGFVFYAWLSAAEPERWPVPKAALWAYSSLALALIFLVMFGYCLFKLIKNRHCDQS